MTDDRRTALRGRIPKYLLDSIDGYIDHGVPLSGMLKLIAENDLRGTFACALNNEKLFAALPDLVVYFHNYIPAQAWGSESAVNGWLSGMQLSRKEE